MFDPLKALLERMMCKGQYAFIFFRDDDVGGVENSLERLIELFAARGVPLNLALVPVWIDPAAAQRLIRLKNHSPDLLCYHQHGYCHVNHASAGKRSEFPDDRPYDKQLGDLKAGMEILTAELGEAFFPAFTPPWNRCSSATLDALAALGFKVVSRDAPTSGAADRGLIDMPVSLDILERASGGGWQLREPGAIVAQLVEQLGPLERAGILLHHQHAGRDCLDFMDRLLAAIADHPALRVVSFERMEGLISQKGIPLNPETR
jgi:hypothetical protein